MLDKFSVPEPDSEALAYGLQPTPSSSMETITTLYLQNKIQAIIVIHIHTLKESISSSFFEKKMSIIH